MSVYTHTHVILTHSRSPTKFSIRPHPTLPTWILDVDAEGSVVALSMSMDQLATLHNALADCLTNSSFEVHRIAAVPPAAPRVPEGA